MHVVLSSGFFVVLVPPVIKILFNICSLLTCYNMHVVLSLGFCVVLVSPIIKILFSICSLLTCYNICCSSAGFCIVLVPPIIKILFNYNMHVVLSLGFCVVLVPPIINIFFSFCSLVTCYNMYSTHNRISPNNGTIKKFLLQNLNI